MPLFTPTGASFVYTARNPAQLHGMYACFGTLLEIYGLGDLHGPARAVLTELVNNAFKANLKRRFFQKQGLDLIEQYTEGQERFRQYLHTHLDQNDLMQGLQLETRVQFATNPEGLQIRISNQAPLHPAEHRTIQAILASDLSELNQPILAPEGGGLGLKMTRLLLANLGLGLQALHFESDRSGTDFNWELPAAIKSTQLNDRMAKQSLDWPALQGTTPGQTLLQSLTDSIEQQDHSASPQSTSASIPEAGACQPPSNPPLDQRPALDPQIRARLASALKHFQASQSTLQQICTEILPDQTAVCLDTASCHWLAGWTLHLLPGATLEALRQATDRAEPPHPSALISATLGARPIQIVKLWFASTQQEIPAYLKEPEKIDPEDTVALAAYLSYLIFSTAHSSIRHEFDWPFFLEHASRQLDWNTPCLDRVAMYVQKQSAADPEFSTE